MTIRIGIIGTGFGSKVHLPAFQAHDSFEVVTIAGRNREKTEEIAKTAGISFDESWESLIKRDDIDLIAISTPPYLHYRMAKKALKLGKHILLEKPTTTNAHQAKELAVIASDNQLVGMMAHEFRWLPERMTLQELIHNKKILGELREVHANFYYDFSPFPYGWLWDSKFDGGVLGAAGSHYVDMIRSMTGREFTSVNGSIYTRLKERKDREGHIHRVTADDGFTMQFDLGKDVSGIMNVSSSLITPPATRVIFGGDEGTVMLEGSDIYLSQDKELTKISSDPKFDLDNSLSEKDRRIPPFLKLLDQIKLSLETSQSLNPSLEDGWRNQLVLDATRLSHQLNSRVTITDYM